MENKVKILSLVSYKFLPPDMGGQKGIAFFNRYLSKQCDLICVTTKNNSQFSSEGYPVKNILSNSGFRYINPFYFITLRRIIRTEKITHLILEHPYYGWLGILLKWFCNIKLVVHSHNIESLRFKSMGKWWWGILWHYEKLVYKKADLDFFIQDDDRDLAIAKFKLGNAKCFTITYGLELQNSPAAEDKKAAQDMICHKYGIDPGNKILLFNGTLDYKPNRDALDIILEKINPLLLKIPGINYKIIICGNKLPVTYNNLIAYKEKHIIYAGFVDDIGLFFKGADIFINPVTDGGGIKTKLVEALGHDLSVITTKSGATGIPGTVTGDKMKIIEDGDWEAFTGWISSVNPGSHIPGSFFDHFYWGNITAKAAELINTK